MSLEFFPGQRWSSETEPNLGLGLIIGSDFRNVNVLFEASGEKRIYRKNNAPLKRVEFQVGEEIRDMDGRTHRINNIEKFQNTLVYICGPEKIPEQGLNPSQSFGNLEEQIFLGQTASVKEYELRYLSNHYKYLYHSFPHRGLLGPRIELLPHQIYIAHEASKGKLPRILLSDEVGLGKTIEAGMAFHALLCKEMIRRCLVIVPEPLLHQWLAEMYRKFNTMFTLVGAEEENPEKGNPFLENQHVLCSLDYLASQPKRLKQCLEAGWDMLIVDEAHHLIWDKQKPHPEYMIVERLAHSIPGVLLLTATPMQLGEKSHFGRLRLLDPERFSDYKTYIEETENYGKVAALAKKILDSQISWEQIKKETQSLFPEDGLLLKEVNNIKNEKSAREQLVHSLVDRHGTGRIIFRNRRNVIKGFPKRHLHVYPLKGNDKFEQSYEKILKFLSWDKPNLRFDSFALSPAYLKLPQGESGELLKQNWFHDPRLEWLKGFLKSLQLGEKALLICSSHTKVQVLQDLLPQISTVRATVFHEKLSLTARDKNAAAFSRVDGPSLLISSEIGSEGRNFQFASHLILFDLPENPELLEQRLGRLHRIGQKKDVEIHLPLVENWPMYVLYKWQHEALDLFNKSLMGADKIYTEFSEPLNKLAGEFLFPENETSHWNAEFEKIKTSCQKRARELSDKIEKGRDLLLELNSVQEKEATEVVSQIEEMEGSPDLEEYLDLVFDSFGILFTPTVEKRGYQIYPGPEMTVDSFPQLPPSGLFVTFQRDMAVIREDMNFMSWDHPMLQGTLDLILSMDSNVCCVAEWENGPGKGILLEAVFICETIENLKLNLGSYFPPTPIRILVDPNGGLQNKFLEELELARLKKGSMAQLEGTPQFKEDIFPKMLKSCWEYAKGQSEKIVDGYLSSLRKDLSAEILRLQALEKISPLNHGENLEFLKTKLLEGEKLFKSPHLRLDALRLIFL